MQHSAPEAVLPCGEKGVVRTIIHGREEYELNYLGGGGGGVALNLLQGRCCRPGRHTGRQTGHQLHQQLRPSGCRRPGR